MSTPPVAEIIRFPPKESYLESPKETLKGFFEILASVDGFVSAHHGLQLEESLDGEERGFIIILWETIEHHHALQKDTEKYPKLRAALRNAADDRTMFHVFPEKDPSSGFPANALEIAVLTLKEGHSREDIRVAMDDLTAQKTPGLVGEPTWGLVHEEKDKVLMFVGWSSKEAHMNARNFATEAIQGAIAKINEHVQGVDMKHTKLERYSPST
ncbi:hypothetical protein HYDPIDRAFT_168079 [Hydnomerulius pinastri MD-312]|uniref:ABM domain-containing protein n=1 Tax=Hydnomerulius pinastri MD-312 TaxID=994086 RepID=A0A0C9WF67_9AGAM|nr:hypothetical protein HYDPIDRAFT_168079 [Hydnomerulius pinastri MD-312]